MCVRRHRLGLPREDVKSQRRHGEFGSGARTCKRERLRILLRHAGQYKMGWRIGAPVS